MDALPTHGKPKFGAEFNCRLTCKQRMVASRYDLGSIFSNTGPRLQSPVLSPPHPRGRVGVKATAPGTGTATRRATHRSGSRLPTLPTSSLADPAPPGAPETRVPQRAPRHR